MLRGYNNGFMHTDGWGSTALFGSVTVGSTRTACSRNSVGESLQTPAVCPRAPHLSHLYTSPIDAPGGGGGSGWYPHFRCCQPNRCPLASTDAGAYVAADAGAAVGNYGLHPHAAAVASQSHSAASARGLHTAAAVAAVARRLHTAVAVAAAARRLQSSPLRYRPQNPHQRRGREDLPAVLQPLIPPPLTSDPPTPSSCG